MVANIRPDPTLLSRLRKEAERRGLKVEKRKSEAAPIPLQSTHAAQETVINSPARFVVLNCGRRWRKSTTALIRLVRAAERTPNGLYFWIWPSYGVGEAGWEMMRQQLQGHAELSEGRRRATLGNGAQIIVKSADNPDSLRARGLNGAVLDECRDISPRVWPEIIRPALADRRGWAMFASTPRGYSWFYNLYTFAQDNAPEWAAFTFPTASNPAIDPAELSAIEQQTPVLVWRQEYLADFSAGAELGVFRNVRAVSTLSPSTPQEHAGHTIVCGIDFAQAADYTVISSVCATCRKQVYLDRFNRVDWATVRGRIVAAYERWAYSTIIAERNSAGGPNVEALAVDGLPVVGFDTTAQSKPTLIQSLALALEKQEIALLENDTQSSELEAYQMTPSANTGRPTYSAPSGGHDDTVMALALAWRGAQTPSWTVYGME